METERLEHQESGAEPYQTVKGWILSCSFGKMSESWLNFEGTAQAVRERPGLSMALALGSGLTIGILASSYVLSKREGEEASPAKVRPFELHLHTWSLPGSMNALQEHTAQDAPVSCK